MEPTESTPPEQGMALPDPLHASGADYWSESRRPWVSLVFLAPLLVFYEIGVCLESSAAARNGADLWLRTILDTLGFGHYFFLPFLLAGTLLAWHHTTGQSWRVAPATLAGMAVECTLLSFFLWLFLQWQGALWRVPAASEGISPPSWLARVLSYIGAGLYEELLFRLMLLPGVVWGLRISGVSAPVSVLAAVVGTSGVFATAHYLGPAGEAWNLFTFAFRFSAGMFFCALFWIRGFGIAAGTHAGYDILVGVLLAKGV